MGLGRKLEGMSRAGKRENEKGGEGCWKMGIMKIT